ncbi:homoserine dehydrogenase [Clostridium sp. YIM B02506]|uniref:homoserine dehydrogenase n=1 Tax=Clostridium sp. YIM B02506 TaxID=2910680 RepID=UPI001EEF6703|nr:homoserine dehydrogenase [Clostridium sp. YIM B02506]
MNLALLGFGGVGKSFIKLLVDKNDELIDQGLNINVVAILNSKGGVYSSDGIDLQKLCGLNDLSDHSLWNKNLDYREVLNSNCVDLMVELTHTNKETGEPGLSHIRYALDNRINVVTGNKGPILLAYSDLKERALKSGVSMGLGCTTGGALPSLNSGLIELAGSKILSIEGILNGTSNFILEEMESKSISFNEALELAKDLGIAESDPSLDIEGWDTAIKMTIMANVIMNKNISLKDINVEGITHLKKEDIEKAKENGFKYKLVGLISNIDNNVSIEVKPRLVEKNNVLASINGKNKGLRFKTDTLGELVVMGGASGTINAAASILRDIINIHKGYKY